MKKYLCFICLFAVLFNNSLTFANDKHELILNECNYEATVSDATYEDTKEKDDLNIQSKSAILIETQTGKVIYEKNADEKLRPASVTKIMTLLLIFEEITAGNMTYDDVVTVTEHAASMGGSQCFFEAGETQSVKDMIKCIVIASGNDAAVAMAEHIAGSEEAFVNMMNEKAKKLGMKNTNFENACGLEADGHVTCARDIAIMSRELMKNHPDITEFSTIWMDHIIHKTAKGESRFDLANTNKFLNQYTGATGLKTGYTSQAKYCMSASASRNGIDLIAVIMGADTKEIRNSEACKLLDYGYSKCKVYVDTEVIPKDFKIPVTLGVKKHVTYQTVKQKEIVLLEGDIDKIEKKVLAYDKLKAPIYVGDAIGVVQYIYEGNVLDEQIIYSNEDIKKISYGYSFRDLCSRLFMIK